MTIKIKTQNDIVEDEAKTKQKKQNRKKERKKSWVKKIAAI